MSRLWGIAVAVLFLSSNAFGVVGAFNVNCINGVGPGCGLTAQTVIVNPTGADNNIAVSIRSITSGIEIIDISPGGLSVLKKQITAQQAWGQGLPNGYLVGPINNPGGPWFGTLWGYRDEADYGPGTVISGDQIGTIARVPQPIGEAWRISGLNMSMRGGPTETDPFWPTSPDRLNRGFTGNGVSGPASYFMLDVHPLGGDPNRSIMVRIHTGSAVVVQRNTITGIFSEITIPIPDFSTTVQLPEPSAVSAWLASGCALLRRRRA